MEDYKAYKEEINKKWLDENCYLSQLLSTGLVPMKPDLGYFMKVDQIEVFKDIFPEEYDKIIEATNSVLLKLDKHYKQLPKKPANLRKVMLSTSCKILK